MVICFVSIISFAMPSKKNKTHIPEKSKSVPKSIVIQNRATRLSHKMVVDVNINSSKRGKSFLLQKTPLSIRRQVDFLSRGKRYADFDN